MTGAGRGAGEGIAVALAAHGARVAVADLNPEAAQAVAGKIAALGVESLALSTDVSFEPAVETMIGDTVDRFGGLDILVNTVAWIDPPGPVVSMPYERWQNGVRINLDSVFLCSKYALPHMQQQRSGFICNVSSVNGTRGFPNRAVYGATKAAILNLTETLSMENRAFGIRVNCLVPGAISGGERGRILRELAEQEGVTLFADMPTYDPPVRAASPSDLGAYVVFLASDAGEAINGQALWMGEAPRWGGQALL
ncbi:SDR family NAD(P)-dependent oxidoreductase [Nakamurella leprariae]|uniref:SDR family oxidoreductase n=1 Tax=Nakamurella leprariae TaxID=2803911 RepID=A0A938YCF4_9ACTN|nr:SDR family NAD(P)-dependent oxidoreductase [Nakamurella leprariae]MBM9465922.1 SDR family oxidoreductase [Nakamurella leprariae]